MGQSEFPTETKRSAISKAFLYRSSLTFGILSFSLFAAVLEGIGLGFILPIVELAQSDAPSADSSGIMAIFVDVYRFFDVPLNLETVLIGVSIVFVVRYTSSFIVAWSRDILRLDYKRHLQMTYFERTLGADIKYFEEEGTDDIINKIVTEASQAAGVIKSSVQVIEQGFMTMAYLTVALYLSPVMTAITIPILALLTWVIRATLQSGSELGDEVRDANETIQEYAQAGTQGIREVKLFDIAEDITSKFEAGVDQFYDSRFYLRRNNHAITNFYQLSIAITIFVLIFVSLRYTSISLAGLGVFLFAMFRLGPKASNINSMVYNIEGQLPHLILLQTAIEELESRQERSTGSHPVPDELDRLSLDDLRFSYDSETVIQDVSFEVRSSEYVALVGQSGAGKSTLISLITRFYEPDNGTIRANGTSIHEFDLDEWRDRLAVVRQNPYIFNESLRYNITLGCEDVTQDEIVTACEAANVSGFIEDLPQGYDTVLGEEGTRLSGGQKQRVALARALVRGAEIILLDEATSDIDSKIEEEIRQSIKSMNRDVMILVIAHRLSTVRNADTILAMKDGRIVERGTHDELLAEDGLYADLYERQNRSIDV